MKKRIIVSGLLTLLMLSSCNEAKKTDSDDVNVYSNINEEYVNERMITDVSTLTQDDIETECIEYSFSGPYAWIDEESAFDNGEELIAAIDWDSVISQIPSDRYEEYPEVHNHANSRPIKATAYIDHRMIELDVNDSRVICLVNFYHNSLYNSTYAELQGSATTWFCSEIQNCPDRLELEFEIGSSEYDHNKIVVIDGVFFCISERGELFSYDKGHTYHAYAYIPLYVENTKWIDIFGFCD